jgi:hypothetical protein
LEQGARQCPALQRSNRPIWERAYFAEGIG